jgi:hypothetical protein
MHDRLRHEITQHGKICEFTCPVCNRFFSTEKFLKSHKCPGVRAGGLTRWPASRKFTLYDSRRAHVEWLPQIPLPHRIRQAKYDELIFIIWRHEPL